VQNKNGGSENGELPLFSGLCNAPCPLPPQGEGGGAIDLDLPYGGGGVKAGGGQALAVRGPAAGTDCAAVGLLKHGAAHPPRWDGLLGPDPDGLVPTAASQHRACKVGSLDICAKTAHPSPGCSIYVES